MENNLRDYLSGTRDLLKDYLKVRMELTRLQATEKLSKALGLFFTLILAFLLSFFVIIFLGMLLAYWISERSGSFALGFAVTALLFALLLGIVLLFRRRLIERPLADLLIRELGEEQEEATAGPSENNITG